MAQPQEFPFDIMDVAELLHLHIRRRQADSVYADCPICGDKRGKMNINFAKNLWRCNYCNEGGGMLSLYGKVYGISNSEAYREICDTLQNGLTAPEYTQRCCRNRRRSSNPSLPHRRRSTRHFPCCWSC